ncbi:MAG: hypothetical protein HY710_15390 [Candidatus Latescibacteria bacterium]|nr:hypothetical protein [Candidatus Latescibacterota bacterium]
MTTSDTSASILVLAQHSDRWFASPDALAELLRLEGINDLETADLERLTPALIEGRSLVVVGPADPSPEAVDLLLAHVRAGGGLICLAPGEAFASALGLTHHLRGMMHGRLRIPLDGFPDVALPIRGWAHQYGLSASADGAEIAPLLDPQGHPTGSPAVLELRHGDGTIIVLAYDLAASTYLLRQGNPLLAGCRASGFDRMRPSDLFDGWHDFSTAAHPGADLQCHFFRTLVHRAWPDETVLPWLWYFPDEAGTILLLTSDDDWSTRDEFKRLITSCEAHAAGLTLYLVQERSVMDRAWLEDLAGRGFDFSIHPDLPPPTLPLWEHRLAGHVRQFQETYGRSPSPSIRNHCITWSGYLEGVLIESRQGFRFDTNYLSLLPQGQYYMTGSGLPMPFVDLSGSVLPVFQLPTQFSDETTLGDRGFDWSLNLTPEQGIDLITGLMRQNVAGQHSMLCVNAHPVSFATYSAPLWEPVMQFARAASIPVWDVDRFSRFWQARRQVRLKPIPKHQITDETRLLVSEFPGLSVRLPNHYH